MRLNYASRLQQIWAVPRRHQPLFGRNRRAEWLNGQNVTSRTSRMNRASAGSGKASLSLIANSPSF